ncbi:5-deoxy-glucuronate isomerase [Citrobacter freundii complex sp. 2025EL-00176]
MVAYGNNRQDFSGARDECMTAYNRDMVMVPQGYHPVAIMASCWCV